jgi:branched-chain amino acid transport system substrate-binding protein
MQNQLERKVMKSHKHKFPGVKVLSLGAALVLSLAACSSSEPDASSSEGAVTGEACTVKVGLNVGLTGIFAYESVPHTDGFSIWADEINAAGGIDGKFKIETVVKDNTSDPAKAATVAEELLGQDISIMFTTSDADVSIGAGQLAQSAGVAAVSFFASSPTLPQAVGDHMFSNAFGDNTQAKVLADYATEQGYKTAYTLGSPDSSYTKLLPEYFKDAFETNGGKVVGQGTYAVGQASFSVIVDEIKAISPAPDVIMTPAYEPDFPTFIKALRGAGVNTPILGTDGIDSATTLALGEIAEGVVYPAPGVLSSTGAMADFYAAYNAKVGSDPETIYAITGYEAGQTLEAAVISAQSCDADAIWNSWKELSGVKTITGSVGYKGGDGMAIREISLIKVVSGDRSLIGTFSPDPASVPKA